MRNSAFFVEFADVIRPAVKTSKIVVTGGFRTSEGMVRAVRSGSTDLVGIGRPTCEEPHFASLILSGKVTSARKPLFPENEDVLLMFAAGTQIAQIGLGEVPFNTALPADAEKFKIAIAMHMQKLQEAARAGIILAGYPEMLRASS